MILSSNVSAVVLQKCQLWEGSLESQKSVMSVSQSMGLCLWQAVEGKGGTGTSLCFDLERRSAYNV